MKSLNASLPAAGIFDHCCRCGITTATVYLLLSSGHIGNCCAVCRATRKGHPFISRQELQATNAVLNGRRDAHELSIRAD